MKFLTIPYVIENLETSIRLTIIRLFVVQEDESLTLKVTVLELLVWEI